MPKPNLSLPQVQDAIGSLDGWAKNCHGASLALVRSGLLPEGSRVARGVAKGVGGQHSWALVTPEMVYDPLTWVVDLTLWSYVPAAPRLYIAKARAWPHRPFGQGRLNYLGPPPEGPVIPLDVPITNGAKMFLQMYAPTGLDLKGWMILLGGPMQGWPSKEIIGAAYRTQELKKVVRIDLVGMLTDENPGSLYF